MSEESDFSTDEGKRKRGNEKEKDKGRFKTNRKTQGTPPKEKKRTTSVDTSDTEPTEMNRRKWGKWKYQRTKWKEWKKRAKTVTPKN